eukprot:Gb_17387 [translate_table: standard]
METLCSVVGLPCFLVLLNHMSKKITAPAPSSCRRNSTASAVGGGLLVARVGLQSEERLVSEKTPPTPSERLPPTSSKRASPRIGRGQKRVEDLSGEISFAVGRNSLRRSLPCDLWEPAPLSAGKTLYLMWRPTGLAAAAAGNPGRLTDGVKTIGMLLTSVKADTEASYPSIPTEAEGRDLDYISLACLETRQRFRCGGVLDGQI